MRIVSISFIFAGANVSFQGIFQALDGGGESLIVSICRQLLFIFPPALFFAGLARKNSELCSLVWTSFPIAEILSAVVAIILFVRIYRKRVALIGDEPGAALKQRTAEQ